MPVLDAGRFVQVLDWLGSFQVLFATTPRTRPQRAKHHHNTARKHAEYIQVSGSVNHLHEHKQALRDGRVWGSPGQTLAHSSILQPLCHEGCPSMGRQRHSVPPATAGQVSLLQAHSMADAQGWCLFGRACDQVVGAHLRAQYHLASSWPSRASHRPQRRDRFSHAPHATSHTHRPPPTAARPLLAQPASPPHTKHPAPHMPHSTPHAQRHDHIPHPTSHTTSHIPHSTFHPTHAHATPHPTPHPLPHPTHAHATPHPISNNPFHILDVFCMYSACIIDVFLM